MLHNIIQFYHKFGTWLLLLLWTIGIVLATILFVFGTLSLNILFPFILAWIIFLVFILWDRQTSKVTTQSKNPDKSRDNTLTKNLDTILTIIFVFGVVTVLLILQYYELRPDSYFIICSILAGILAFSILFSPRYKSSITHLIKISIFSFLTTFSIFKIYYWAGNDTWEHAGWNELVSNIGNIYATLGKEVDYPIQHIFVAITDILVAVDIRTASVLAIGIPSVLLSVVIYIILRKVIGEKFALISCLLTNLSPYLIEWRIYAQTTSYGLLVFLILLMAYLFAIFNENKTIKWRFYTIYFLLLTILCLGHQFTSFMVIFVLIGCWVGSIIYHKSLLTKEFWLLICSGFVMFIIWIIASFGFNQMVARIARQFTVTSENVGVDIYMEPYVNIIPPNEIISALTLPLLYTIICLLPILYLSIKYSVSNSKQHKFLHIVAISTGLLFCSYCIATIIGGNMEGRFTPLLALYSSICIGYLLWYLVTKFSANRNQSTLIKVGVGILIVVYVITILPFPSISPDNPVYKEGSVSQDAISYSDLIGLTTLSMYYPDEGDIYCESSYIIGCLAYTTFIHQYHSQKVIPNINVRGSLTNWNTIQNQSKSHLILRDELYSTPASNVIVYLPGKYKKQYIQLTTETLDKLFEQNMFIYTNGAISSIIIR